ncbi:hypothetical protein THMIRHAS_02160 [Thiosulfatimonas sediminis]|uniref:GGDEF-domain containing protein n=1 Tax=Thiosulfatimonas sediminis TaxID=2675054 RepID=A0A6F8PRT8_9GAMM|nr:bifunctional diguanylate cyclase/phosphodiesterase [Thiosulfatimonas sediminis]BBP44843.1 hypothetical protein THMIRHAS_02160 [Thiosulfatimonas sediminis]
MLRLRFSALLLFLLPAIMVVLILSGFNILVLKQFSDTRSFEQKVVNETVHDLHKTMQFIEVVGVQYQNLNALLIATDKNLLSQTQAYRMQSKMVDELAHTEEELVQLKTRLSKLQLADFNFDLWQESFTNFKNFSIMASDIVVIDPNIARNYISSAQEEYFQFVNQSNSLSNRLSNYTDRAFSHSHQNFQTQVQNLYYWGAIGLISALLIAVLSAARLSNYLRTVLMSLHSLATNRDEIPPLHELKAMSARTKGELHLLAKAVLKFKKTLELNKQEEKQILKQAFYDDLTKLPNMQMLNKELQNRLKTAQMEHTKGILIKLNINGFTLFNNALGYEFGDQLLRAVAKRLNECQIQNKQVFRGSSDEFFILLEPIGIHEALSHNNLGWFGDTIQQLFSPPIMVHNEPISVTLSQGIVDFPSRQYETSKEIIRNAMIAMHHAKFLGNHRYVIYHKALSHEVNERFKLQKELKSALEKDELTFFLQTQIHPTDTLPRAEALIRWNHPKRGWIRPDIFIALAEESSLIIDLDKWMLTQVCRFISEQAQQGLEVRISINISGHHFAHPHFLTHVQQIFEQTGVNPKLVTLELTESVFLNDFSDIVKKMKHLRTLGAHFSIDDFGTGYSSLSYLKRLPVDEIKVDQTFVRRITTDIEDWTLVKAVFEMAQTFHLDVVVEGVETAEQEAVIQQFGPAIIQGYLHARPIDHQAWLKTLKPQN